MSEYEYRSHAPEASHVYLHPTVNKLLCDVPEGSSVLDLGCGNGSFIAGFRNRGWRLFATDSSASGISFARATYPDISFFQADVEKAREEIVARVGHVDAVISTEVIEHLYDPRAFLKTIDNILIPGGRVVLTTPYHGYAKNLALALTGKLETHFTVLWDHGHIKFWSRKTLTAAICEVGLRPLSFRGSGRVPYFWNSMAILAEKPAKEN